MSTPLRYLVFLGYETNGTALSILLPLTYIFSRLVAWYRQEGMRFRPPFDGTRFDTIRALADTMRTDRAVERLQKRWPCGDCSKQQRHPKDVDRLEGSREAEHAWYEPGMHRR